MSVSVFADKVLDEFAKSITDKIFLEIENDRELMQEYLRLVEQNGLQVVNSQIGRKVKARFALNNDQTRQESPQSKLIKTHQQFD